MGNRELYSTLELEEYVNATYNKLKEVTEQAGVYRAIDVYFASGTPRNAEGKYCYSDEEGYHYCYTERGTVSKHQKTKSLSDVVYWIIKDQVFSMAFEFESKNRINDQDPRRLAFEKEKEFMEIVGINFKEKIDAEIRDTLEKAPYQDHLFCNGGVFGQN